MASLAWSLLTTWCLWCTFTLDLHWSVEHDTVSIESRGTTFKLERDIRYTNGLLSASRCDSRVECAVWCATLESCSHFNYGAGQCELLSAEPSSRSMETGWSHGYNLENEVERLVEAADCAEVLSKILEANSGVYHLYLAGEVASAYYCDMDTDGGGWTVIQRRQDGSVDFYVTYEEYAQGFGDPSGEFWLGNRRIHNLTSSRSYSLRIDLEDFEGETRYALYGQFAVGAENDGFRLTVGDYTGDAADSFRPHTDQRFSAKDMDQDGWAGGDCAGAYEGGWWFNNCHYAYLNGIYYLPGHQKSGGHGLVWSDWKEWDYSLKATDMKIRPVS